MSDFNLGPLVRTVVKTTTETDPAVIADEVFEQIDEADWAVALRTALREMVRVEITRLRDVSVPSIPVVPGKGKSRAMAVRAAWAKVLDSLERNAAGEWARLRDFTRDDLLAAAAYRMELAEQNTRKAEDYRVLAGLVSQHGVKRLSDLPAKALQAAVERVAA